MQTLEQHQQDLAAIESLLATLEQLHPGTALLQTVVKDTIVSYRIQKAATEECIHALTENEIRPQFWQDTLAAFHSDGGVWSEEEEAAT